MLDVESSKEDPPEAVDVVRGGVGVAVPQPQRLGVAVAGQVLDGQVDQGTFDDGKFALVVGPGAAPVQGR